MYNYLYKHKTVKKTVFTVSCGCKVNVKVQDGTIAFATAVPQKGPDDRSLKIFKMKKFVLCGLGFCLMYCFILYFDLISNGK